MGRVKAGCGGGGGGERLSSEAEREIGILDYVSSLLAVAAGLLSSLADRARAGIRLGIAHGNPDALFSWQRGAGEGIVAKIRNALVRYRPLGEPLGHREPPTRRRAVQLDLPRRRPSPQQHPRLRLPGCQRLAPPPAPTRRRRQVTMYLDSFARVWDRATQPYKGAA